MSSKIKQNSAIIRKPLTGFGVSVLITLICSALMAWLIGKGSVAISAMGTGALAVQFLASFAGCAVAAKGEKGLIKGLAAVAMYFVALLCLNALFMDGQYAGLLVGFLAVSLGYVGGLVVNNLPKRRHTRGRRKR